MAFEQPTLKKTAMTDGFDDMYNQIMRCEHRIEERQRFQNELRSQIQNCKASLQNDVEDQNRLQKELNVKVEQLCAQELKQKGLAARETVLDKQRDALMEEHTSLVLELTSIDDALEEEIVTFCQTVESHREDLQLTTSCQRARHKKAAHTLDQLVALEQTFIQELSEYETHKESISRLEAERYCLQQSLCDIRLTQKELEECITKEQQKLDQLTEERRQVAKIPSSGDEFIRLKGELMRLNTDSLERQCSQLQNQAKVLQQKLYIQQQQQQRQQLCQQTTQQQTVFGDTEGDVTSCGGAPLSIGETEWLENPQIVTNRSGNTAPTMQTTSLEKSFDNCDDTFDDFDTNQLPDLVMSEAEKIEAGEKGLKVCNRSKPVFKPLQC